jgi:penicillin-insensitive murein DD-endopeptidase
VRSPWLLPRVFALVVAGALGVPSSALGAPAAPRPAAPPGPPKVVEPPAMSLGAPNEGRLVGGARLDDAKAVRVYPSRAGRDRRWGLPELVGMLTRSSERVAAQHPGSVLGVGDLSQRGGGDISLHHSHESGRDADVGFYVARSNGKGFVGDDFVAFDREGRALDGRALRFDDARNWALVESWLSDPKARVTHVFIAEHLRARLLAYARSVGAPERLRARAAFTLTQPRHALPHDDHFHVRIACPPRAAAGCVEWPVSKRAKHVAKRGGKRGRAPTAHPAAPPSKRPAAPGRPAAPARVAAPNRPAPALHATPAREDFRPFEADVREVVEQTDEGGELKIVD